jgi:hypothetical protein
VLVEVERIMASEAADLCLGPFAEGSQTNLTVGYRDLLTGRVAASIELPAELIERAVLANVSVEIGLSGEGEIVSTAYGGASEWSFARKAIPIDQLVEVLLDNNNLQMEETKQNELRTLLERLQRSIRAVQCAIADLEAAPQ